MRVLLTIAAALCLSSAASAETITATNGATYTRAADGHLYPTAHVRADGTVSLTPLPRASPTFAPFDPRRITPAYPSYFYPAPGNCPGGTCPNPRGR